MLLPKTRTTDIIIQDLGSELLLYDLRINKAFALNETLKIVYQSCDGNTSYENLKHQYRYLNDDVIKLAINELSRENLLDEKLENTVSRRQLITRAALAVTVLPAITVIVAPTSASAASCIGAGNPCQLNNAAACCSTRCNINNGSPVCDTPCITTGNPCDLNNAAACCSTRCNINNGFPICDTPCIAPGNSCQLNNAAACCSTNCLINNGTPVCA